MRKSGANIAFPPAKPERDQIIAACFLVFVTPPRHSNVPPPAHRLTLITYDQVAIIPRCTRCWCRRTPVTPETPPPAQPPALICHSDQRPQRRRRRRSRVKHSVVEPQDAQTQQAPLPSSLATLKAASRIRVQRGITRQQLAPNANESQVFMMSFSAQTSVVKKNNNNKELKITGLSTPYAFVGLYVKNHSSC